MSQGVFQDFFINPGVNLDKGHPELRWAATLDPELLVDRWTKPKGQQILSQWKSSGFSRDSLDSLIGKFYGQTDLRGVPLAGEVIEDSDLSNCDMFNADLSGTTFRRTKLVNTYFSEADIRGACFNYCNMSEALTDNAEFDSKTSLIGVDLNKVNFNLAWALRTHALNQQKIYDLDRRYPKFSKFLEITCDYGRSFPRFLFWCLLIIAIFTVLYNMPGIMEEQGFWNSLYTSVTVFTTLGSEISAASMSGRLMIAIESCLGYIMGSLLIGVLAKRIMID